MAIFHCYVSSPEGICWTDDIPSGLGDVKRPCQHWIFSKPLGCIIRQWIGLSKGKSMNIGTGWPHDGPHDLKMGKSMVSGEYVPVKTNPLNSGIQG